MHLHLALMLSLGAATPGGTCKGERLTLLPFDSVAVPRTEVRRTEDVVRAAIAKTSGVCLESRRDTVDRLIAMAGKQATCADAACRAAEVKSFGTRWLVRGRVLGLGGKRTVALVLIGPEGSEARGTFRVPSLEAGAEIAATRAFSGLWEDQGSRRGQKEKTLRPWPQVLMGVGVASLVAGVGFGLAARSTEKRMSQGAGGCEGEGEAFRQCFADGLRRGERQSLISNALLGTGAMLGAGGAILFVWELP